MKPIPDGTQDEMVVETTPDMGVKHLPVPMYSTPTMVGHFEQLCLKMMIPYLAPGESSVGYKVNIKHSAPTPIGMKVTIKAKAIESSEKKAVFEVEAYNETGAKIGEGTHERRAIDMTRFGGNA
ncbi:MAG TPA: thioesterase family protein [Dehalococcoidia bacterium]|jgi:predicted thioesterase|nr:thioesterase family protein [Dehalococcoidia bacterium]